MMFHILYWFRKAYIRLVTAITILAIGPWIGFQIFVLMTNLETHVVVTTVLCCVVFVLSVGLVAFPEKQVKSTMFIIV
jgi:hypothetical protein